MPLFVRLALGITLVSALAACTEESRNKLARQADNYLGQDLQVSYIDSGKVVKTWAVRDGKITSAKNASGGTAGYYYFWTQQGAYVQVPIERTIVEELKAN